MTLFIHTLPRHAPRMNEIRELEKKCFNIPAPDFCIQHFLQYGFGWVTIAEEVETHEIVGAQYSMRTGEDLRLWETFVHPDWRGQRIASLMTEETINKAKSIVTYEEPFQRVSTILLKNSPTMYRNVKYRAMLHSTYIYNNTRKVYMSWSLVQEPRLSAHTVQVSVDENWSNYIFWHLTGFDGTTATFTRHED